MHDAPRLTRAHLIWAVGVFAYLCAVSGRASFGVASVEASARFGVDGAVLSLFGVVQLGTYAAAQIPAGVLLDRIGPRRMMVLGAVTMAAGQVLLALATDVPTALIARLLTGVGDAATLISMVRLIATWFPTGQVPLFTQLATMIGQFGQAVAAVPFLALLVSAGWTAAWSSLAFLLLLSVLLVIAVVRDEPPGEPDAAPPAPIRPAQLLRDVFTSRAAWSRFLPACADAGLGQRVPVPVGRAVPDQRPRPEPGGGRRAPHRERRDHGGDRPADRRAHRPLPPPPRPIGLDRRRHPLHRVGGHPPGPGPAHRLELMPLIIALAVGSATCSVGFDLARTGVPRRAIGTATGMVNIGGYSFSLLSVLLVGVLLDLLAPDGAASLDDYRLALSMGVLMGAAALGLLLTTRCRADDQPARS